MCMIICKYNIIMAYSVCNEIVYNIWNMIFCIICQYVCICLLIMKLMAVWKVICKVIWKYYTV